MKTDQIVPVDSLVNVSATVKNIGSYAGIAKARLYLDSEPVDSMAIELKPGQREQAAFAIVFPEKGDHTVAIGDLKEQFMRVYSAPLESNVLHLNFDEHRDDITPDRSGFSNDGKLAGNYNWVDGKFGRAIQTGKDGFVELPQNQSLDISGKTVSVLFWIYPMDESGADFVAKGDYIVLKKQNRERINFFAGGWGRGECIADVPENWNRRWHHLAGICDGDSLKVYIGGIRCQSIPIIGGIGPCPFPWNIGRNAEIPVGRSTNGYIDDVRIYIAPLSHEEIQKVMLNQ